jgi:hypothetical protein
MIPEKTTRTLERVASQQPVLEATLYEGGVLRFGTTFQDRSEWVELGVAADGTDEWYIDFRFTMYGRACVSRTRLPLGLPHEALHGAEERPGAHAAMLEALKAAGFPVDS